MYFRKLWNVNKGIYYKKYCRNKFCFFVKNVSVLLLGWVKNLLLNYNSDKFLV